MKIKLLEVWHDLCRDAARQRIVVVSLSIVCALFYLISAVSFGDGSRNTVAIQNNTEIPIGYRAVAMQSAGPLPELHAGDFVDVIIDATIALERVLVFDVINQPNRQTTVVLAVSVDNTAMVANAASLGVVSLVLVG